MTDIKFKEIPSTEAQKNLSKYPELLQGLLYSRGIITEADAEVFLNPEYERDTFSPSLLMNMDLAVVRVLKGIKNKEKIVIFGDYDSDGIPAGVLVRDFFNYIGHRDVENYIPHRHEEGFGLNVPAVEKFAEEGVELIITLDCGMTDVEEVARANALGVDVIITDHHLPGAEVPDAEVIVNPNQDGDTYPNKNLCGAGVGYKLVQSLVETGEFDFPVGWHRTLLDMVGIATIADRVSLTGENRALASRGLVALRMSMRPGLIALLKSLNSNQKHLAEDDVGFVIGPRINAASRMDLPEDAFKLLAAKDLDEAKEYVTHLNSLNDQRKILVASMVKELHKRIKELDVIPEVIVMGDPHWRPGLVGLAANAVADKYDRPAFIWGREGSPDIKGSCRSRGNVDVVSLMRGCKNILTEFGGHTNSGGFSIDHENIHKLSECLNSSYKKLSVTSSAAEALEVDGKLLLEDVTWSTYSTIEQLSPFGEGNPRPIFLLEDILISDLKHFGKQNNHLELGFGIGSSRVSAIGFFKTNSDLGVEKGDRINLLATMEKSVFRGRPELRLRIVDVL